VEHFRDTGGATLGAPKRDIIVQAFYTAWDRRFKMPAIPGWRLNDFNKNLLDNCDATCQINVSNPYGLNKYKEPTYKAILASGKPRLVLESAVFRRGISTKLHGVPNVMRLGWNHYNASGEFNNKNSPPDRWHKLKDLQGLEILPWKEREGNILIILQKENDSSLANLNAEYSEGQMGLYRKVLKEIRELTDNPVVIRPHFLYKDRTKIPEELLDENITISKNLKSSSTSFGGEGLDKDLSEARCVIGYNSNTLIETTLLGIPTITLDPLSHAYKVSHHSFTDYWDNYRRFERDQWAWDLSYMQWTLEEINNGTAWGHLKGVYFE